MGGYLSGDYWSQMFYITKGVIALAATLALVAHMSRTWGDLHGWGQRMRYLTLLYFAVLLTGASVEQTEQHAVINLRNVGAIIGAALLLVTMLVSLYESRNHRP